MTLSDIEERLALLKIETVRETARLLRVAKSQCKHGEWLPWLRKIGVSRRTAQSYLRGGEAVVYFVRCEKLVKIGRTVFLENRFEELRRKYGDVELLGTLPGHTLEYKLHQELEQFRVAGEWFVMTIEQVTEVIARHSA